MLVYWLAVTRHLSSSFQPVSVLKGKLAKGFKSGWFRSSLVIFQFAISIILIIGTVVIIINYNLSVIKI